MYHWIILSIVCGLVRSSEDKFIVNLYINLEIDVIQISNRIIGKSESYPENVEKIVLSKDLLKDNKQISETINKWKNVVLINAESEKSKLFINCYYQYLLKIVSENLKKLLFVSGKLSTCFKDNNNSDTTFTSNSIQQNDNGLFLLSITPYYYRIMLRDLISFYKKSWKEAVIIYDQSEVFNSFQNVYDSTDKLFHYRFWTTDPSTNIEILKKLHKINVFIIDLNETELKELFQLARSLELFNTFTTKIILIDRGNLFDSVKELTKSISQFMLIRPSINKVNEIKNLPNLSIDSKNINQIIRDVLLKKENVEILQTPNNSSTDWVKELKISVSKEIKPIKKTPWYYYFDLSFEGISIFRDDTNKVFYWSESTGLKETSNLNQIVKNQTMINLKSKILRVTTIASQPFVYYKTFNERGDPLNGNDRFSGMAIDILNHLSKAQGFMFELHLVKDYEYGTFDKNTGNWSGMVGELINNNADLAVAPLTMTYQREQVIDFTYPWMMVGITAVTKKRNSDNFLILESFSISVWCVIFISYVLVSLTLFLVGRLTPYEWNKSKIDKNENSFTLIESLWYTIEFVKGNKFGLSPKAFSTRLISTVWWLFIILIIALFSANLVRVLLFVNNQKELRNFEDLVHQKKIMYGTLAGGSTYEFFQKSKIGIYKRMSKFMNSNRIGFVRTTRDGIDRVLKTDYAFILESTMAEYFTKRNCKLLTLSDLINPRGYAFGLRSGNKILRDQLSEGILQLIESGTIETIKYKWYEDANSDISCSMKKIIEDDGARNQLNFSSIGYLFYLLILLLIFSFLVCCCEILHWACSSSSRNQNSVASKISGQIKLAFSFSKSTNETNDKQIVSLNEPSNSKETPVV